MHGDRSGDPRGRHRDGHDAARAAAPGRAAARAAVDRRRRPRRGGGRRRLGHDRRGDRRRRSRRIHLPRPVDGRHDGHPRRRRCRPRCSRSPSTARLRWLRAPAARRAPAACTAPRRRGAVAGCSPCAAAAALRAPSRRRRSSSARRTSPSRSILGELVAQTIERDSGLPVERQLNLGGTLICDRALLRRRHRRLRRVHRHGADRDLSAAGRQRIRAAVFATRPRRCTRDAAARCCAPLGFNNTFAILVRGDDARELAAAHDRRCAPRGAARGGPASATSSSSGRTAIPGWRRPTACSSRRRRG